MRAGGAGSGPVAVFELDGCGTVCVVTLLTAGLGAAGGGTVWVVESWTAGFGGAGGVRYRPPVVSVVVGSGCLYSDSLSPNKSDVCISGRQTVDESGLSLTKQNRNAIACACSPRSSEPSLIRSNSDLSSDPSSLPKFSRVFRAY